MLEQLLKESELKVEQSFSLHNSKLAIDNMNTTEAKTLLLEAYRLLMVRENQVKFLVGELLKYEF